MYGADVMIGEDGSPYLLELSFAPDCTVVSRLYPSFWNDCFGALFLGESTNVVWL
jgi:hypothetical protein